MALAIPPTLGWSTLTAEEQNYGVTPNRLKCLRFEAPHSELSEEQQTSIRQFFAGCRLATTDAEFRKAVQHLKAEGIEETIQAIASDVLKIKRPLGYPSMTIGYEKDESEFTKYFHQLLNTTPYLMHPARHSDLIEALGDRFEYPEETAKRLQCLYLHGPIQLEIEDQKKRLQQTIEAWKNVTALLSTCLVQDPAIVEPKSLRPEDLLYIPEESCKKHVAACYNFLASRHLLEILHLPSSDLYQCDGSSTPTRGVTHEDLIDLATAFYEEYPEGTFTSVIEYLQKLKITDLNNLNIEALRNQANILFTEIKKLRQDISTNTHTRACLLSSLKINSKTISSGNFSFLIDPLQKHVLTTMWSDPSALAILPASERLLYETIYKPWSQNVEEKGWDYVVRNVLAYYRIQLGVMDKTLATL